MIRRRFATVVAISAATVVAGVVAVVFLVQTTAELFSTVGAAAGSYAIGDDYALIQVRSTAQQLTEEIGYVQRSVDAETRAATTFSGTNGVVTLTPLMWSGVGAPEDPVIVDVRMEAQVEAVRDPQIFGRSRSAGSAVECYRFTIPVYREAESRRIDCPSDAAAPRTPVATVPPQLPSDAEERLRAVLASGNASVEDIRAVFTDPALTVETTVTDAGETVAAVGATAARGCVVLVRHTDGTIDPVDFRRISLEPGEGGCSTSLYTNPPF